jgi:diguanylate cyclase (GGDEF)-like protein/putative nucleotidyltransferase with HDIG domain/PAS domain S-box-containing protein
MTSYMSSPHSAQDNDALQPAAASLIDLAGARLDRATQTDGPGAERDRLLSQFFASVVEHANDLVIVIEAHGRITLANNAGRALLGISGPITEKLRPLQFVAAPDRAAVREAVRRACASRVPVRLTARLLPRDADPLPVDFQFTCVPARSGRAAHLIVTGADARERIARDHQLAERALRSHRHMAEHAALHRIASAAARGDAFELVMSTAATEIATLIGTECALIGRFADRQCVVVGLHDPHPRLIAGDCIPLDQALLLRRVCDEDLAGRIDSYARLDAVTGITSPPLGLTASVAAPIHIDDRVWGVVMAATRDGSRFPDDTEGQLSRVAEVVGIAVTADRTRERLASQALTDALTGLPNQRAFQERLSIEVARSRRYGRPVSLAILDLDHFKRLNDAHGHPVGDAILVEVGYRLTSCVRRDEMIARIGGEEFAWILPESDLASAAEAIERARRTVTATPMPQGIAISLSAGVCDLDAAHGSTEELVRMADSALYWAKSHGRDQTFIFSPDTIESLSADERARRIQRDQSMAALRALARAVDAKDPGTLAHSERVADLACELAARLGWSPADALRLRDAALLHDIGKVGIPDAILLKNGGLEPEEFEQIKRHTTLGAEIGVESLDHAQQEWIRQHHERWDGSGYPDGVAGADISEGARILAVADAWDVMTTARSSYAATREPLDALSELERCSGSQFWPEAVRVMTQRVHEMHAPDRGHATAP